MCGLHAQEGRMHVSCMRYLLNTNAFYYNAGIPTIHVEQIALTVVFVSISSASFTIFSLIDRATIDWPFMLYDCFYSCSMKIMQKNVPSTLSLYFPFGGVHLLPNLLAFSYVLCYLSILSNTRALISFFYLFWLCFYLHFRTYYPPPPNQICLR